MKKTLITASLTSLGLLLAASLPARADHGETLVGAVVGGAVGSVIGRDVGGRDGAVIGAAVGAGLGAAIGSDAGYRYHRDGRYYPPAATPVGWDDPYPSWRHHRPPPPPFWVPPPVIYDPPPRWVDPPPRWVDPPPRVVYPRPFPHDRCHRPDRHWQWR